MASSPHEVFLSFRGTDTRKKFTCLLRDELVHAGYCAFMDNNDIGVGEEISTGIRMGIKHSKSAIIVFSENFADSPWCLDELVLIMKRWRTSLYPVLPIFYYGVDCEHVKNQTDSFGRGLLRLGTRHRHKMEGWREALTQAADLEGWPLTGNMDEFLSKIVEEVGKRLRIHGDSGPLVKQQYPSVRNGMDHPAGTFVYHNYNVNQYFGCGHGMDPSTVWNLSTQQTWPPNNIPSQPQQRLLTKAPSAPVIEELNVKDASTFRVREKFVWNYGQSTMPSASTQGTKPLVQPKTDLLSGYPYKCPPGGEDKVVLYTSLGAIRSTSDDCQKVIAILHEHKVMKYDHRDAWTDINFKNELKNLVGRLSYPRLFVMGRDIGGVNEVNDLDEKGELESILNSCHSSKVTSGVRARLHGF